MAANCLLSRLLLALCLASGAASDCLPGAESCQDAEESALLQNTRRKKLQVVEVHPRGDTKFMSMKALADMNLLDLDVTASGGSITKDSWMAAFKRLDLNGNGKITARDLREKEDAPPRRRHNLTRHDFNLTRKQIRAGLALLTTWYPEDAGRLIEHEALLTTLAYNGTMPPDDEPEPDDPLEGIVKKRRRRRRERQMGMVVANQVARKNECVFGVIKVVMGVFNILFGLIGIQMPSGNAISTLIEGNSFVLDQVISLAAKLDDAAGPMTAAGVVKDIFDVLYEEGIFSQAIQEALADLNWWQFSVMSLQVAAIVAAWLGTGGVAFVANIALVVFDVVDLWEGAKEVRAEC